MKNTREKILIAAMSVWNQDYSAPLKAVAVEANISRMTLHRYFCGREAILEAIVDMFVERMLALLENVRKGDAEMHHIHQMEDLVKNAQQLGEEFTFLFDLFEQKGKPQNLYERFHLWEQKFCDFLAMMENQNLIKTEVTDKWALAMFEGVMKAGCRMRLKGDTDSVKLTNLVWDAYSCSIFTQEALAHYQQTHSK